jgi:WD40 repeat protein
LLVAASGDTLWIGSNGLVSKVDPNTGVVSPPEDVGVLPRAVDMETVPRGDGVKEALWTADGWSKVFKVRPSGGAKAIPVLVSATVGARPTAIAADSRHLWVAALGSKALYRIGLAGSPDLGPPIVLGDPPTSLAIDGRFVWVASSSTGRIWRIDSTTDKVMSPPIEVHLRINGIAVAGRSVWVTTGGQLGSAPPTGAVAYQGRGAVHIAGPGIGGAKTIQEASMPAWSPDGMHIAYVLQKALYVANWDGSDPVVLFGGDNEPVSAPAWSADGTQIAFVSSYGGTPDIRTIGADGSNPLTCEAASPTDNTSVESYPAYSPDGKTIAFLSDRNGARAVFTANSDCSGEASAVLPDAVSNMGAPAWSPDGTVLAFWNKDNNAIVVANPSNHGAYNVTDLKVTTLDPVRVSWSPDGRLIAFSAPAVGGGHTVYVMYADGNGRHPLTRLDNAQNPAWRPLRR